MTNVCRGADPVWTRAQIVVKWPLARTVTQRTKRHAASKNGQVAQLVEQRTENPRVGGSIPSLATIHLRHARTNAYSSRCRTSHCKDDLSPALAFPLSVSLGSKRAISVKS